MTIKLRLLSGVLFAGALTCAAALATGAATAPKTEPALQYTADGKLVFPKDYRTWIFLTSGHDMAYTEGPAPSAHVFDNVFVDRPSYESFLKTGTWPDKTVMVLEIRKGEGRGSINKNGQFQVEKAAAEIHVKDVARYKSGWAFFPFSNGEGPAAALPQTSGCNVCHEQHGAVDTTFVQFYPTLLPKAAEMKTISAAYLAEEKAK